MKGDAQSEVLWPRGRAWALAVAPRLPVPGDLRVPEPGAHDRGCSGRACPVHLFGCAARSPAVTSGDMFPGRPSGPRSCQQFRGERHNPERGETGGRSGRWRDG